MRALAAEVINRPGALSPRESSELYERCRQFLTAAKQMCQAVWVNFDDQAGVDHFHFTLSLEREGGGGYYL